MKNDPTRSYVGPRKACVFLDTLTNGVTKVPKGCLGGFCHFWHLVTLGFSKNMRPHT
jgi:hypothetical protein